MKSAKVKDFGLPFKGSNQVWMEDDCASSSGPRDEEDQIINLRSLSEYCDNDFGDSIDDR